MIEQSLRQLLLGFAGQKKLLHNAVQHKMWSAPAWAADAARFYHRAKCFGAAVGYDLSHRAQCLTPHKKRAPQGTLFVFAWSGALETGFDLFKLSDHFFTQSLVHWHLR
jgi:hypothetical protein